MNKNIRQDYFSQVKKVLDKADKAEDIANHFRGIVIIGDKNRSQCYSWLHAPKKDLEKLILHAMRDSEMFAYCSAKALETIYGEQSETKNDNNNEENQVQEG